MSHFDPAKETASNAADQAKRFGTDMSEQAFGGAQNDCDSYGRTGHTHSSLAGGVSNKAHQASNLAGEKWEQTKQGASDAGGAAHEKATAAQEKAGGILGSIGAKVEDTYNSAKNAVTGNH